MPQSELSFSIYGLTGQEAYARVDAEIANLETRLRSLKTLRNTISPISRLPNELLSKVFLYSCRYDDYVDVFNRFVDEDGEKEYFERDGTMCWIISWVSQHWRSVAHSFQRLWDVVDAPNGTIHQEIVRHCALRSKNLGLRMDLVFPSQEVIAHCLGPYIARIHSLSIDLSGGFTALEGEFWTQPALALHSLNLEDASFEGINLFGGVLPQIRRVHLMDCSFDWRSPIISSSTITQLLITCPQTRVPVPWLRDLLSSLPALSKCWLRNCIASTSTPEQVTTSRIFLPSLRTVWLEDEDEVELSFDLLSCLSLPNSSIKLSVDRPNLTSSLLTGLIQKFQKSTGIVWKEIRHLHCQKRIGKGILRVSTFPTITYELILHDLPTTFDLTLFSCNNLQLERLQTCTLHHLSPAAANKLGQLHNLRSMRMVGPSVVKDLVKDLQGKIGDPTTVSFPALTELTLVKIHYASQFDGLSDVLAARKTMGRGLKKLTFGKSKQLKFVDIAHLAGVVDVLKTDFV
ncbi:hypothetical protein BDN72DRAFT_847553 [Pluteus cervinus]|uniref:Uncharacterized protein n=1 Tax=Pluteus cervinus TaxID=181527 RepID=A0ACD3ADB4_9AGAR|nr:hypothetical protein BDN72DRAFT_847553 [Pluteus cervinus]